MSRRGPRPASDAVQRLVADLAPPSTLDAVQRVWPEAAGEALAAQATPTGEAGGVLTVTCSSAVWAQEIDLLGAGIVERLNAALGGQRIASLRCQSVPARSWSRQAR